MGYIKTTDKHTADTLRQLGYKELPKDGERWVFANTPKVIDHEARSRN